MERDLRLVLGARGAGAPEVIAHAPYHIAPGGRVVVRARLSTRARRVLHRYGRLRVKVSMSR